MPLSISGDGTITGLSAGGLPNGSVTADDLASTLDLSGKTVTGLTNDSITEGNTTAEVVDTGSDGHFKVTTEGTERLRVDSSGRLGIGTASPISNFHVSNAGAEGFEFIPGDTANVNRLYHYNRSGAAWVANRVGASYHRFDISGAEAARIDSSGRLLVGTTSTLQSTNSKSVEVLGASERGNIAIGRNDGTLLNGYDISEIGFWTQAGGDGYKQAGSIIAQCSGTHSSTSKPTDLIFSTTAIGASSPTERVRIDNSGKFGVGTSPSFRFHVYSPSTNGNVTSAYFNRETGNASLASKTPVATFRSASTLGVTESSSAYISIEGTNGANGSGMSLGCGNKELFGHHDTTFISFYNGYLWQNTTWHWATGGTSTYQGISYDGCEFSNNRSDNQVAFTFNNSSTSTNNHVLFVRSARTTTNSTYNLLRCENGNSTGVFQVKDSGNCQNTNNSYGSSSDIKLKRDIVDASSQWDDIKNLRVRKFRWISEVEENENASYYLGLIAQEAELVSPGLIEESNDYEEFEKEAIDESGNVILDENGDPQYVRDRRSLGTTTKELKYSILYMKAVKALQEAMERIETLESRVAQLEGGAA